MLIDIKLENKCSECKGSGRDEWSKKYHKIDQECKDCNGKGYILTDLGTEVLAFIRRWL